MIYKSLYFEVSFGFFFFLSFLILFSLGLFVCLFVCYAFIKSQSDIRKWFMKSHEKGNGSSASKPAKSAQAPPDEPVSSVVIVSFLFGD